jgi:hypothetical protein
VCAGEILHRSFSTHEERPHYVEPYGAHGSFLLGEGGAVDEGAEDGFAEGGELGEIAFGCWAEPVGDLVEEGVGDAVAGVGVLAGGVGAAVPVGAVHRHQPWPLRLFGFPEDAVHGHGPGLDYRPDLLPIDSFSRGRAAVAHQARDLFKRKPAVGQQGNETVPKLSRRPLPRIHSVRVSVSQLRPHDVERLPKLTVPGRYWRCAGAVRELMDRSKHRRLTSRPLLDDFCM